MKQFLVTTSYLYNSAHNFGIICSIIATRLQIVLIANQDYTVVQWWCKNCPSYTCPNNATTRWHAVMRFFSVAVQKPPLKNFLSEGHGIGQLVNLILFRKNLQPGCKSLVAVTHELGPLGYHLCGMFGCIVVIQRKHLRSQVLLNAVQKHWGMRSNHLCNLPLRQPQVQEPLRSGLQVLLDAKTKNLRICGHCLSNLILCQPQAQEPLNSGFQVLLYAVPKDWADVKTPPFWLDSSSAQISITVAQWVSSSARRSGQEFEDAWPLP